MEDIKKPWLSVIFILIMIAKKPQGPSSRLPEEQTQQVCLCERNNCRSAAAAALVWCSVSHSLEENLSLDPPVSTTRSAPFVRDIISHRARRTDRQAFYHWAFYREHRRLRAALLPHLYLVFGGFGSRLKGEHAVVSSYGVNSNGAYC